MSVLQVSDYSTNLCVSSLKAVPLPLLYIDKTGFKQEAQYFWPSVRKALTTATFRFCHF